MSFLPPGWTPSGVAGRVRSLWRGLRRREAIEAEMEEEFRHHIELRTEDLMRRQGLSRQEAYRRARLEFGHVEGHREDARTARGLHWFDEVAFSWLDLKLGLRMLVRYPALTVVGGLAMAFGIWVAALTFEIVSEITSPELPLPQGQRIVGIRQLRVETAREGTPSLGDFKAWREEVETIDELSAYRTVSRNLILDGRTAEPIEVAEISAAGLGVARVPPLLGRTLVAADEEPGAPGVGVIGYDLWQSGFSGDPRILGRTVGIGGTSRTVVGIMPEGFTFPVAHQAWIPLARPPVDLRPGEGAGVQVLGRLAPGTSALEAQAELEVIGDRWRADRPNPAGRVEARVMPFARSVVPLPDVGGPGLVAANAFVVMLLLLLCGNVALLVFARTATREREVAVRSALGAGRLRIMGQLFAEALVLGGLAAMVGLAGAASGKRWYVSMLKADSGGMVPFWIRDGLSPTSVLYLLVLTVLGAAVVGVAPALKVTGRNVESGLRRAASAATGFRISGIWTPVIVAQVAVTLAFPVTAFFFQRYVDQIQHLDLGVAADDYLTMRIEWDASPQEASHGATYRALEERIAGEPGVRGVTFASRVPGDAHPSRPIEVEADAVGSAATTLHRAAVAAVDIDFFDVLEAPIRAGRAFASGDPGPVIVNQAFVDEILEGRNPVGLRVRYAVPGDQQPAPWMEVVGVVENLGVLGGDFEPRAEPGAYIPLDPRDHQPLQMIVHVPGEDEGFARTLRTAAAAVDPELLLRDVRRLDRVSESRWREAAFLARIVTGISGLALILSLMTIYSMMSFAVSRRTREIGVRVALGASRRRVIWSTFRAPLTRVAVGIAVGIVLVSLVTRALTGPLTGAEISLIAAYAATMLGVCLLGCVVPTHRALGIEPTEALKAD